MNETYKDIQGYEGKYQISNLGNVYSLITNKILKPRLTLDGYYQVDLCKDGVKRHLYIHRLVAQSFLDNPKNYKIVNHKDENFKNNVYYNLEWCTAKYNCNYGTRLQRIATKNNKPILQFDLNGNFIKEYESITQASKELNNSLNNISQCCLGRSRTSKGYVFKFKNDKEILKKI